jgi:metal-responsive CopG/Arc/MetJ family transcriptional regulator
MTPRRWNMTMSRTKTATKKEKVTVSIDAELLHIVDDFVEKTEKAGNSRSSVFELALHLWKKELKESFDERYYAENAESLRDETWSAITTEAAKHIWKQ